MYNTIHICIQFNDFSLAKEKSTILACICMHANSVLPWKTRLDAHHPSTYHRPSRNLALSVCFSIETTSYQTTCTSLRRLLYFQGWTARQIACELQTWLKFIQVPKTLNFWFFSSSFFTIDFKICLYASCFDTSHCPHDILWLHFANSSKLWENKNVKFFTQSFEELAKCSHNMSCGQCEASKQLAYRHILKSIVKKLEEKNQKFSVFGTWINFNQVCSSHAICSAAHPWLQ